ncbi:hypothetical protein Ciccas_001033 [Cichlidogyrus casuarinus]|uniref:P-type domain-containing protein n=1 Tax=Cichlidogyrus casuarinus TaxID=1844966 RepID=A0ABD2QLA1_9PLAT
MKRLALILILCFVNRCWSRIYPQDDQCVLVESNERLDCYPEAFASEAKCLARGCCWRAPDIHENFVLPATCYFPTSYPTYSVSSKEETDSGILLHLHKKNPKNVYSEEFPSAKLEIKYETDTRFRMRFTDNKSQRWEPPIPLNPAQQKPRNRAYSVEVKNTPLGIIINRGNKTLLEFSDYFTTALILSDQFLQVSFKIHAHFGYGLGERRAAFPINLHKWDRSGMWNRDMPPTTGWNLYGTQNFFVGLDNQGEAFGIFLLNSNAQEVALQPVPALTYRTTGGILDFFVFTGPSPQQVVSQYMELIGKPMIPPYWSLGFHLCRYGYKNLDQVREVLERNIDAGIPIDVQWFDIDYMDAQKDWTTDPENFAGMGLFIEETLHETYEMRNVLIVDPAINNIEDYEPYEKGIEMGIFINDSRTGKPIIGQVWPGDTLFPDFSNPATKQWWGDSAKKFHTQVPFDGLWIDMNEPSNFVDGSKTGCDPKSKLDNPPYVPQIIGGTLYSKTLCPSAVHYNNTHYNLHNLYGYMEAKMTNEILREIRPNRRPFILTRSTFSGSSRYTFHWTGDNFSSWDDLVASIAQILNFNIFGIPMVGADICGFNGQTTDELCLRWSQLGAFYPFSRNHNTINSHPQDPAHLKPDSTKAIRDAIRFRYFLLPYLYTLFHQANTKGFMVARPLAFEFPQDISTYSIESQYMLGSCILVSPVTEEGVTSIFAYLPKGEWIFAADSKRVKSHGSTFVIDAPKEIIPIHFRAGCSIPLQKPESTTARARKNGLGLLVILAQVDGPEMAAANGVQSQGDLIWDDGESDDQAILHVAFKTENRTLVTMPTITPSKSGSYDITRLNLLVDFIAIKGIKSSPKSVRINGNAVQFKFDLDRSAIIVHGDGHLSWNQPLTCAYFFL